jgi:hypothetical protein
MWSTIEPHQLGQWEAMKQTEQLLADLDYLEKIGMTVDQLRSLHHWSDHPEASGRVSFATVRNYFAKGQEMRSNNAAFADRLRLVADLHRRGLAGLIETAIHKHPL